eukprot:gene3057-13077_t
MLQRIGPVSAHSSGARLSSSAWVAVSGDIFRRSIPMVACPLPKGGRHEGRIGVVAIPPTVLRNVGAASNATGIQSPTSRGTAESRPLGVVITGGSKGLGFAMAQQFLSAGDAVFICGRNEKKLGAALESLKSQFPNSQVFAQPCDVSDAAQVEALAAAAKESLGTLHLWINNAGEVTEKALLIDLEAAAITKVTNTSTVILLILQTWKPLLSLKWAAIDLMLKQTPSTGTAGPEFHIFNFGFSTWGASLSKTACTHKMTKMALTQLTKSLSEEVVAAAHEGQDSHADVAPHEGQDFHADMAAHEGQDFHADVATHEGQDSHADVAAHEGQDFHADVATHEGQDFHADVATYEGQDFHADVVTHEGQDFHADVATHEGQDSHADAAAHEGQDSHADVGSSPVARRFFNTLAEEPETVASELVPRIRAIK